MNILNYGADPRSLDGMSRLRCTIEITLPAKDLGSVRGCTNSGQPHWSTSRQAYKLEGLYC